LRDVGGNAAALGETQEDEFKSHSHPQQYRTTGGGGVGVIGAGGGGSPMPSFSTLETGGSETRPKNLSVNFFIKINKLCNFN
jgi:hypothetical protein